MALLFKHFKQVYTIFPSKKVEVKPKEQKVDSARSSIYGRNFRNGNYKDVGYKRADDPYNETIVH